MKRRVLKGVVVILVGLTTLAGVEFAPFISYAVWGVPKMERAMICAISQEWACPASSVELVSLGAATYRFKGCGHDATYHCKMPGEGCASNETAGRDYDQPHVLNTRACLEQ